MELLEIQARKKAKGVRKDRIFSLPKPAKSSIL
jgi:hypothetical protein